MNSSIASGGKAVYGAAVGILMLDARFPRIPGDIGHAGTFPFPVLYRVVAGASPNRVVRRRAEGLLEAFESDALELVAMGADGITSNCGFLSLFQRELAGTCGVPVATSSLMQAPLIERLLRPGQRIGIFTVSAASLTSDHLELAGISPDTPVQGTDGGREFTRVLLGDEEHLDVAAARQDVLDAGEALVKRHPEVGAVLLECTNMCPYAASLRRQIGRPVFDMYNFIAWFQGGLAPRSWNLPP